MSNKKVDLMWKSFKGIRKLDSINSDVEFGADVATNIVLSKEKSGQQRSIKSSGWFNNYASLSEHIIRLFPATISGYTTANQLIAFTKTSTHINAWIVEDDSGFVTPFKVAEFDLTEDVTDCCMVQFGDRMVLVVAFNTSKLGFICYSADDLTPAWTRSETSNWFYRQETIVEESTEATVTNITSITPYKARLAINGKTTYAAETVESIYGIWFSESGNPLNFTHDPLSSASSTSAFFVEIGEYANKIIQYHGITAFANNSSYNIYGTSQDDIGVEPLTAKGVIGNAAFAINGQCAYVDNYSNNIFILTNNIDSTIGFDRAIGNNIQDFLSDVKNVTINIIDRRVRMLKETGQSLVYDVDIGEWTVETFNQKARAITFLNKELFCDQTETIKRITTDRQASSVQIPTEEGYFSYYKTNLIWLDSQTSVKNHIYPFAVVLEPQTNNDFFIKFTTDRGNQITGRITRSGYANVATYSESDTIPLDGSKFVDDDDDYTGRVFFARKQTELLVTVERPPYWRYLTIEIYTTSTNMEFNISGIEAKQTFITDEMLDY